MSHLNQFKKIFSSYQSFREPWKEICIIIISVAVIFSWAACSSDSNNTNNEFLKKLEELGFLKYADPGNITEVKKELAKSAWPFAWVKGTQRSYPADAENLAEGQVAEFLEKLRPFLESQGVQLNKIENLGEIDQYHISINGKKYLIWSKEEAREAIQTNKRGLIWGLSTVRTFSIVNELLQSAGSTEKLYAVSGGNDLCGVFLTKELVEYIIQNPGILPEDKPYIPEDSYPWFGQPH